MNVLSLFDGYAGCREALERAGHWVDNYYASEIDPYAMKISSKNYPDIKHLGDISKITGEGLPQTHLLAGGSPCQGFSLAGKQLNFEDPRSKLFFEFLRLRDKLKPVYFLLENVAMQKDIQDAISSYLGVEPVILNSELVSAQKRKRLYWTNIPGYEVPADRGILLKDIVLSNTLPVALSNIYGGFGEKGCRTHLNKSPCLRANSGGGSIPSFIDLEKLILSEKALAYMDRHVKGGRSHWDFKHHSDINNEKSAALVANLFKGVPYNVLKDFDCIRKFHPIECERLQTLPDNYTEGVSDTQRLKMLGNGWNIDSVVEFFKHIPKDLDLL